MWFPSTRNLLASWKSVRILKNRDLLSHLRRWQTGSYWFVTRCVSFSFLRHLLQCNFQTIILQLCKKSEEICKSDLLWIAPIELSRNRTSTSILVETLNWWTDLSVIPGTLPVQKTPLKSAPFTLLNTECYKCATQVKTPRIHECTFARGSTDRNIGVFVVGQNDWNRIYNTFAFWKLKRFFSSRVIMFTTFDRLSVTLSTPHGKNLSWDLSR